MMSLVTSCYVMVTVLLSGGIAWASSDIWTGATSANWNQSNWSGGNNPPTSGDSLIFTSATGAGGVALNNNWTSSSFAIAGITYNSTAAAFAVSGNTFVLAGPITNNSTSLETINDSFSLNSSQIFSTTTGGGNLTLAGNLSGAGGLTTAGSGILTLGGANSYSGATTVNAGTLRVNNSSALPAPTILTVNNGGTLDLNGTNAAIASLGAGSLSGVITNSASKAGVLSFTNLNVALNTLVADGPAGAVALKLLSVGNVTGGALGNNANTFSGGLILGNTVSGSGYARLSMSLDPVNTGVPGNITNSIFGRGTITIGQSATDKAQLLCNNGGTYSILNNVVCNTALGSDRVGALRVDATTLTMAGTLTANLAPLCISCNSIGTGNANLTGQVTGTNGLWLRYNPSDTPAYLTCTLSNTTANTNNYQGTTLIDNPFILALGAANQIPNGSGAGNITNNGIFKLNGYNETINGLVGGGMVDGVSGAPTLTVGDNNTTSEFDGVITNSGGSLSLAKIGSGTFTLSATNSYSGTTIINAGVLQGVVGGSSSNSRVLVSASAGNNAALGVSITDITKQWTCSSLVVSNAGISSGVQFNFALLTPSTLIAPLKVTGTVTFSNPTTITVLGNDLPTTTGNGYPLLTWGTGSAPDLASMILMFNPVTTLGNLAIVGNTLYLQCSGTSTNSLGLTVTNGAGTGIYTNGSLVPIVAADDPPGMVFSSWVINSGNPVITDTINPSTTLTMPANSPAIVTATFTNIPVPAPISGKGYRLAWNDEFDGGLKSIDLNNTQTNGYKWYVQAPSYGPIAGSFFTNPAPSVMRILGASPNAGDLVSAVSMNTGFNLMASDGFYIEGRLRWATITTDTSAGWPAFWLRVSEGAFPGTTAPWPGTTNGWQNTTEIDTMEYIGGTYYGGTLHNWYGLNTGGNSFSQVHNSNNHVNYPDGNAPTNVWHTYGCLVVPSTAGSTNGMGYCQMFLDNVPTADSNAWVSPTNLFTTTTDPTVTGNVAFSTIELWHYIVNLGTASSNIPMDVDWVRVWQPVSLTSAGVRTNALGFYIRDYHPTNEVQTCTNLNNPIWQPLQTNSMSHNPVYFSDSTWTNHASRFYRLSWP